MKSKSFVLMTLSLGFGLIAALGITQVMGKNKQPVAAKEKMGQVVVAVDHLAHKTILTEENVRIENWPLKIIPEDAIRDLESITDMAIMTRLSKGLPVLKTDIVNKKEAMGINIPPGYKVVAIKVSGGDTVAGLLRPGDHVDVIGLFTQRERGKTQTISRTFLKGLQVFSVGSSMTATPGATREGGNSGNAIVGVLVNEKQSEEIVYVQKTGAIKLVMRGDEPTQLELDEVEGVLARTLAGPGSPEISEPEAKKQDLEQMIVWVGNDYEVVSFEPGRRPKAAFSDREKAAVPTTPSMINEASPADSDFSEDIDPELEEDQYPAS